MIGSFFPLNSNSFFPQLLTLSLSLLCPHSLSYSRDFHDVLGLIFPGIAFYDLDNFSTFLYLMYSNAAVNLANAKTGFIPNQPNI